MQRELNNSEVVELLSRQYSLAARVAAHKALVAAGRWSQTHSAGLFDYPIDPAGLAVTDDKYGNVIVFPDAAGGLHYNAGVLSGVLVAVQTPPYVSPTGNSVEQSIADLNAGAAAAAAGFASSGILQMMVGGAVIVALFWVFLHQ